MRLHLIFLCCFGILFTNADYQCGSNGTACNLNCSSIHCADAVIDASQATTATVLCPDTRTCHNMSLICPIAKSSSCDITCTNYHSCDRMRIHSQSASTTVTCVSTSLGMSNICTNVTLNLSVSPNTNNAIINCSSEFPFKNESTVCDAITVTSNAVNPTTSSRSSLLSFLCEGSSIRCDFIDINAVNVDKLKVVVNGSLSNINNSIFTFKNNLDIVINDGGSISMSSLIGQNMNGGSSASIRISNASQSISNIFEFDGIASLELVNPDVNDLESSLLHQNNITITNSAGRMQNVSIRNINGDLSNQLTASEASLFTLECTNKQAKCGNLGLINVDRVEDICILIDSDVKYGSTINAPHADGINLTVLEGGLITGLVLDATYVEQLTLHVYGQARDKNTIKAANAMGFDLGCYNPRSCSDEFEIYTSPSRTHIQCIGTACDRMALYVNNLPNEVDFSMSDCPCEDERRTMCMSYWVIKCLGRDTTGFSKVSNGECLGSCCGTIIDQLQETFSNRECPLSNHTSYVCQENKDCIVECTNPEQYNKASPFNCSSNGVVDASMAKTLQIFCREHAPCSGLRIVAPKQVPNDDPNQFAQVSCTGNGCSGLRVDLMQTQHFYMDCLDDSVCANISIVNHGSRGDNLSIIPIINIDCSGGALCDSIDVMADGAVVEYACTNSACQGIMIDNDHGYTMLNIAGVLANFTNGSMFGDGNSSIWINNTNGTMNGVTVSGGSVQVANAMGWMNELNVSATHQVVVHNIGSLSNSSIEAASAHNLSVMCSSHCLNVSISVPIASDAVSSLLCVNKGCPKLTFYTVNGMNDFDVIRLEDCSCNAAVNDSCIDDEWDIYCGAQDGASVVKENSCEGSCCGDILHDLRVKGCDYGRGGSTFSHTGAIVAGICGGILALVVIAASIYLYKKKRSSQRVALLSVNDKHNTNIYVQ
eukprot:622660_1